MTTRNQKRSNKVTPANASDNGAILDMLTSANANGNKTRSEEITQIDPAVAKDVRRVRVESSALAKEQEVQSNQNTDPAAAKDRGELLEFNVKIEELI